MSESIGIYAPFDAETQGIVLNCERKEERSDKDPYYVFMRFFDRGIAIMKDARADMRRRTTLIKTPIE